MMRRFAGGLAFAICALDAAAFLLPPTTKISPFDNAAALSLLAPDAKHQTVTLPCQQCSHGLKSEDIRNPSTPSAAYSIAINFTLSHDATRLEVNGEPIYPLGLQIESILRSPKAYVSQVPSSASVEDIEDGKVPAMPLEVTGHGVTIVEETVFTEEGSKLIPIEFSIFELENQPVSLDHVVVQLFKAESGDLSIMHVGVLAPLPPRPIDFLVEDEIVDQMVEDGEGVPTPFGDHRPHRDQGQPHSDLRHEECNMLPSALCKLWNMLEAKISGKSKGGCPGWRATHGRPHMGKLPSHIKPHFLRPGPNRHYNGHYHGRPHHMGPHGQHHRHHGHHHRHHFMHTFSSGLVAVLIPTMAGVAVGMAVSLLGLIAGRLVRFIWINLYRGGRCGYASVALGEQSAERDENMKDVEFGPGQLDAPPVYEAAPTYEEVVRDEK